MRPLSPRPRRAGEAFYKAFKHSPGTTWSAPGRVNLIGEHTDYNEGLCLPLAIGFGVDCAAALTNDGVLRVASAQRPDHVVQMPIEALRPGVSGWSAYVAGVVWVLREQGVTIPGLRLAVDSDLPEGAGLSSSAALECAVLGALTDLLGLSLAGAELARTAQRAENEFVGVPCGLMDQLACTLGTAGHALLFDAQSEETRQIPLSLQGLELLVIDTRSTHALVDGGYAERRRECREAAALLAVQSLRDATPGLVEKADLPEMLRARARHVVTENARVAATACLLDGRDPAAIGTLLSASHASLRADFQVSVPELDVAVATALDAGALGARMTGGGFGGSIIALLPEGHAEVVVAAVEGAFEARGYATPRWFRAAPGPGLRREG